jgi:hypothetical protein
MGWITREDVTKRDNYNATIFFVSARRKPCCVARVVDSVLEKTPIDQ